MNQMRDTIQPCNQLCNGVRGKAGREANALLYSAIPTPASFLVSPRASSAFVDGGGGLTGLGLGGGGINSDAGRLSCC